MEKAYSIYNLEVLYKMITDYNNNYTIYFIQLYELLNNFIYILYDKPEIMGIIYYTLFWTITVYSLRYLTAKHAASCVSLTFCAWTVIYGSAILYLAWPWPSSLFEFNLYQYHEESIIATNILPAKGSLLTLLAQRIVRIQHINEYLYFAFTYLITDMIYDYDIRFVLHHILTATAVFTTWCVADLHGSFLITAFIAEIGGVVFHISKLIRKQWMELIFLIIYTFTRMILFPLLIAILSYSIWFHPSKNWFHLFISCWATGGTSILVGININWARKQWIRYKRKYKNKEPIAFSVMYKPKHKRQTSHQRVYVYAPETVFESASPPRYSKTTTQFVKDGMGFVWDLLS